MHKIKHIRLILLLFPFLSCKDEKQEIFSKIEFQKKYYFGEVHHGDTIKSTISIKNISNVPLTISKIGPSCGCTAAVLSDSIVQENEVAKIEVSYTPNKDQTGLIQNSIVIEANTKPSYTVIYLESNVK